MLASIIAPKATKLELIEVVPAHSEKKTEEPHRLLPSSDVPVAAEKTVAGAVASSSLSGEKEADKEKIFLSSPVAQNKTDKKDLSTLSQKTGDQKIDVKQEDFVLLKPLVAAKKERIEIKKQKESAPVLRKPAADSEKIVLIPPQEDVVLLKKPGLSENDSSIEIFLDE